MRRRLPIQKERKQYDAEAHGSCCRLCPLSRTCKPVSPHIVPGASLSVVSDWPSRSEDERGEPTRHPASELLRKNLQAANVDEYSYTWALLCRVPKGTSKQDVATAIECCSERLRADVASQPTDGLSALSERKWILSLGPEAFRATTGKLQLDPWVGAPVDSQWGSHARVIPTFSPGWILKPDGSAYAGVFGSHVWRASYLSDGRLGDFEWPEDVVDEGPKLSGALHRIAWLAENGGEVAVDIETRGLGLDSAISCIGFASHVGACCIQLPVSGVECDLVRRILASGTMVGQNISAFDRQVLAHHGYELTPHYEDTLLAASILDPQLPKNLSALVGSEFHAEAHKAAFKADKETGVMSGMWDSTDPTVERDRRIYCLRDSYMTMLLWGRQKQRLAEYGWDLYQKLKAADVIALSMRKAGLEWNFAAAKELEAKYTAQRDAMRLQLQKGAKALGFERERTKEDGKKYSLGPLNPGSFKHLQVLFYNDMKIAPSVFTPEGAPSTNDDALLEIMKSDNPAAQEFARKVADYREAEKALGTYVVGLRPVDGPKVYGMWRAHTAISGRWSCTEVPLQTLSSEMRRLVKATPGKLMCEADLPSAEVRTVMLFIGDDEMIALLNDGGDLYSTCATEMFGRPVSKTQNPKLRQLGKLIILASNYGAAPDTVWRQVIKQEMKDDDGKEKRVMEVFPQLNVRQVDVLQRGYFRKVPKLPVWQRQEAEDSGKRGYYYCPFSGRRVRFFGAPNLNLATNLPNQGTVAWYMDRALKAVWADLKPTDTLLTYVHDSLCVESLPEDIKATQAMLHKHMEGELEYRGRRILMAPVESKIGLTLAEVK